MARRRPEAPPERSESEQPAEYQDTPGTDVTVLQAISKAELDQQITTARAFPRSLRKFMSECLDMATLNEQVASECIYAIPRGGKSIQGPSARLAEIVASAWGNCQAGGRIIDEGPEFITAQGIFRDLERNVSITYEVRRRITDKDGRRFNADMIGVTGAAATSIALRNAVFRGVPKAFWSDIYAAARKAAVGDVKTIANKRADALEGLQKMGVPAEQVFLALNVKGIQDIGTDELLQIKGWVTAIKDGETTIEEAFAVKAPTGKGGTKAPEPKKPAEPPAQKPETVTGPEPVREAEKQAAAVEELIGEAMREVLTVRMEKYSVPVTLLLAQYKIGKLAELPLAVADEAYDWIPHANDNA